MELHRLRRTHPPHLLLTVTIPHPPLLPLPLPPSRRQYTDTRHPPQRRLEYLSVQLGRFDKGAAVQLILGCGSGAIPAARRLFPSGARGRETGLCVGRCLQPPVLVEDAVE